MNRYNSSQYGAINRRPEPMDIESETPYYLPQNKNNNHQNPKFFNNQQPQQPQQQQPNRMYQQHPSSMSHSQNISSNYSGVNMNNSNVSMGRQQQGMPNCYQQGYGQHPQQQQMMGNHHHPQQQQMMNHQHQPPQY